MQVQALRETLVKLLDAHAVHEWREQALQNLLGRRVLCLPPLSALQHLTSSLHDEQLPVHGFHH